MIELIQKALEKENVAVWRINKRLDERAELYFIKKTLDIPRFASIPEYEVSVYRDFETDGKKFRGVSTCYVEEGQTQEEIDEKIKNAYFAAQFVRNPFYELPDPIAEPKKASKSDMAGRNLQDIANAFADAVLSVPTDETAFVNSLEIFVQRTSVEILASTGLHVSYDTDRVRGEFVTQSVSPVDVEQYRSFAYDNFDLEALKDKVASAIEDVRLRASASRAPAKGRYNVLLTGENLKTFYQYYLERGNAAYIFPGYSTWKKGDTVQRQGEGEKLSIELLATAPYSSDGIAMKDVPFIEDGELKSLFGATRFMRYLGEEPIGDHRKFRVHNGRMKFEDMKKEGTLETVSFSDFQMDAFTGNFGGELRLALLRENGQDIPMTGGSINGRIADVEDKLIFSVEQYEDSDYIGPYALLIPDVPVAGE